MEQLIFKGAAAALLLLVAVYIVTAWYFRIKMALNEKRMKPDRVPATGSLICHGMTFKESGRGVCREQQYSLNWYERISK